MKSDEIREKSKGIIIEYDRVPYLMNFPDNIFNQIKEISTYKRMTIRQVILELIENSLKKSTK